MSARSSCGDNEPAGPPTCSSTRATTAAPPRSSSSSRATPAFARATACPAWPGSRPAGVHARPGQGHRLPARRQRASRSASTAASRCPAPAPTAPNHVMAFLSALATPIVRRFEIWVPDAAGPAPAPHAGLLRSADGRLDAASAGTRPPSAGTRAPTRLAPSPPACRQVAGHGGRAARSRRTVRSRAVRGLVFLIDSPDWKPRP